MQSICVLLLAATLSADSFVARVTDPVYPDQLFPQVIMETTKGNIVIELDRRRAPVTVNNFLSYLERGDYDGTIFHRVIAGFVVQGGGYKHGWVDVETTAPIMNESGNGLTNQAYTIAMARHDDPHSATSQFYFNLANNESLDPNRRSWGYTVFGQVIEGREVLEAISNVPTEYNADLGAGDVPIDAVVLKRAALQAP